MTAPLLELERVRCSVDEVTLLDNVSLCTSSHREGLSGKTAGVAALLEGRAQLLAGSVKVLGQSLEDARRQRLFGCALRPTQVPAKWTVRQVLELAAQMAGYSSADSHGRAKAVLGRIEQPALLKRVYSRCTPVEQSLVSLALGLIAEPLLLFVSLPLGEFRLPDILRYGPALARALNGLDVIAELRIPATLPEELSWVSGLESITHVFESGPTRSLQAVRRHQVRYLLRATGDNARASASLRSAGFEPLAVNMPSLNAADHLTYLVDVDLAEGGLANTGPLLNCVVESGLELLELSPVASAPNGK